MWFVLVIFVLCLHLYCRISYGKTKSVKCLVGKTALVTGGDNGIGFQVCLNLASRGCRVIIADKSDSEESRQKIIKQTDNNNIICKKFDLASFKSVRQLAKEIIETEERLDILINNAGVGGVTETPTEDGNSLLVQVNHFGGFLLTHLLLGLLKKSAPSRIIFTSSPSVFVTYLNPESLLSTKYPIHFFSKMNFYGSTKLAAIVIARIFAEKLKGTGVTANSISPGWVCTGIWSRAGVSGDWTVWVAIQLSILWCYIIGKSPWEGAQTTTHVAVSEDLDNVSGKFFADCSVAAEPPQARGEFYWPLSMLGLNYKDEKESFEQKIWRISEERSKLRPEERI